MTNVPNVSACADGPAAVGEASPSASARAASSAPAAPADRGRRADAAPGGPEPGADRTSGGSATSPDATALRLERLTVRSGERTLLSVPSASFRRGLVYAIVGVSGAGKSTLLRVANLLEKPDAGALSLCGGLPVDLTALTYRQGLPLQRQMAFVAQKPVMFQGTVFDNVALGLVYRGVPRREIAGRVDEALRLVGLERAANRKASSLSGGEAQRAAVARALVVRPKVLMLDEPTSNLDPANVALIEGAIARLRDERSTLVLLVTHQLHQARRLADRCLFLDEGRIEEENDAATFFERPAHPRLRRMIEGHLIY